MKMLSGDSNNSTSYLAIDNIGLYPVVDSSSWVKKLASYGVKTIQLRIKDLPDQIIEEEIKQSIQIASQYQIRLFINDYWLLAIKYHAYGVHLGQEDLITADLALIQQHGLRLGISTHNHQELICAKKIKPSYIALGPIYPTTSKIMPWQPQGLPRITEWLAMIDCPLVVIGGINLSNIDQVMNTGVTNIALISAITKADDPKMVTKLLLNKLATMPSYLSENK